MAGVRGKNKLLKAGVQIGHWLLLYRKQTPISYNWYWQCRCLKCKQEWAVREYNLLKRKTAHCRDCNPGRPTESRVEAGKSYGWWVAERQVASARYNGNKAHKKWLCRCKCGTSRYIRESSLARGITNSCGCGRSFFRAKQALVKHADALQPEMRELLQPIERKEAA